MSRPGWWRELGLVRVHDDRPWEAFMRRETAARLIRDEPGRRNGWWRHGCRVESARGEVWEWNGLEWRRRQPALQTELPV